MAVTQASASGRRLDVGACGVATDGEKVKAESLVALGRRAGGGPRNPGDLHQEVRPDLPTFRCWWALPGQLPS